MCLKMDIINDTMGTSLVQIVLDKLTGQILTISPSAEVFFVQMKTDFVLKIV